MFSYSLNHSVIENAERERPIVYLGACVLLVNGRGRLYGSCISCFEEALEKLCIQAGRPVVS